MPVIPAIQEAEAGESLEPGISSFVLFAENCFGYAGSFLVPYEASVR